ncbi:MAG: hypothetical protein Fur003_2540 [Candidatus Dojkabacteria bacterium]
MSFSNIFYKFLLGMLFLTFNAQIYGSLALPKDLGYFLAVAFLFSLAIVLHEQVLDFMTIRKVFITRMIVIAVLVAIVVYIMDFIVPGFTVGNTALSTNTIGIIAIQAQNISKYGTIALIALTTGLLAAIFEQLKKTSA